MKTEDYKKKFIELFKQMEDELGKCAEVDIERVDERVYGGEIVRTSYKCIMRF